MTSIPFTKMVGAGNDFIVLEAPIPHDLAKLAVAMCARQNGVGADGLLIMDKSSVTDYKMRIINSDGSEAEMCGNGARCMAAYIVQRHNPGKNLFGMETLAGVIMGEADGEVARVQLSQPKDYRPNVTLKVEGQELVVHYIDTGVPHTVVFVQGLHEMDVQTMGRTIRYHKKFDPRGTNVNFVEYLKPDYVELRTYERGVEGETLACGTGSVASALISYIQMNPKIKAQKDARMRLLTASREVLEVTFDYNEKEITNVWLKGSAKFICGGEYFLKDK